MDLIFGSGGDKFELNWNYDLARSYIFLLIALWASEAKIGSGYPLHIHDYKSKNWSKNKG